MNDSRSQDDTEDPQRPTDAPADAADDDAAARPAPAEEAGEVAAEASADDEAADEAGAEPTATPPARRRGGRVPGLLGVLALVLALAAAGAAGWLAWRLHELEQRLARVPEERAEALAEYARSSALADLEGRVATLARDQESVAAEVRERIDRVEEGFASLRELAGRDQVGWRMAEVRYLLAVATRRLALAGDVDAAIAALEGADDALASLGDARLLPLRERIVEDLEALRAVEPADVEGIALRLRSLEARVADLPVQRAAAPAPEDDTPDAGATGSWWQRVKHQLAQFVVVRREPGPDPGRPPAPAAAEALAPGEALRLALADATRAALARDARRYDEALDEAIAVARERFAADAPATSGFVERLRGLRERAVRTDLPDLAPALELAERLSARLQRSAEAARDGAVAGGGED